MFKIKLPDPYGVQDVGSMEGLIVAIQAFAQHKFVDFGETIDKIQMDMQKSKHKVMPGIKIIPTAELTDIAKEIDEKIGELKVLAGDKDEDISFDDITPDDLEESFGKIYFPEPFGPYTIRDEKEAQHAILAYTAITMPDLIDLLDDIDIIREDGAEFTPIPGIHIVPMKDFVKMKRFIALKVNAYQVMQRHFEKHSFNRCPRCSTPNKEAILSCWKCGFTKRLNDDGVDNL